MCERLLVRKQFGTQLLQSSPVPFARYHSTAEFRNKSRFRGVRVTHPRSAEYIGRQKAISYRYRSLELGRFEIVSNEPTPPWRGTSADGGYTTAADLMKFAGALMRQDQS